MPETLSLNLSLLTFSCLLRSFPITTLVDSLPKSTRAPWESMRWMCSSLYRSGCAIITPTTPLYANEIYGFARSLIGIVCCFALETVNTHRGGQKSFAHFQTKTPKSVIRSDLTARQLQTTGLPLLNTAQSFLHSVAGPRYYAAHHQTRVLGHTKLTQDVSQRSRVS